MPVLDPIPAQAYNPTSTHNTDTLNPRGHLHNDPTGVITGTPLDSTIGMQDPVGQAYLLKKTLVETAKARRFSKLSGTINMPKHKGRRIVANVLIPLLDDRNLNDQGIDARGAYKRNGNLYGSSKDIGKITRNIPVLTEIGGRVNRVGFSRSMIEGTFHHFGFFWEWSKDFADFDSNPSVVQDMYREAIKGAEQMQEDMIQIDLLQGAGTVLYSGTAMMDSQVDANAMVDYATLRRLSIALDDVGTPKKTTIMSGSRMIDTKTLTTTRYAFIGSELQTVIETMVDTNGNPAFIPVAKYAANSNAHIMDGEIGAIGEFRFVVHDNMFHWAGVGDVENPNSGLRAENGKYNVYPILVVGDGAFTTIGFQSSGDAKLEIKHKNNEISHNDPYGKFSLTSIQWWYGMLIERPERIGLIKTVAYI